MSNFPSIQLPSSRKRAVSKPQLKSEFEAGYTQIRSKATRAKHKWVLSWEFLPKADWETLKAHFIDNVGNSFTIAKEMIYESEDVIVVYSIDELSAGSSSITGFYSIEVQVEEL